MTEKKVTIALTRYREPDALVSEVLRSACSQLNVQGEVLLIEQNAHGSFEESEFGNLALPLRIIRKQVKGLSEARNISLESARFPYVLYLDADAVAEPTWAAMLAGALSQGPYAIVGSRILPRWPGKEPRWARAMAIRDQYSLLDLGSETKPFARVVGAAFGLDRRRIPAGLRFDPALGRRNGRLFGGEETEFCRSAMMAGCEVGYVGGAVVEHIIQPERIRPSWIMRRMFYAGHGRGRLGGAPAPTSNVAKSDWLILLLFGPAYLAGWLRAKLFG